MSDARRYAVWPDPRSRSRALESWKSFHLQQLSSPSFTMAADNWPLILKLRHNISIWSGRTFDIFCPSFLCHVTLNLAETSAVKSPQFVPHGTNLFISFLPARCYPSAVLAVIVCLPDFLFVSLSQVGVLLRRLNPGSRKVANNTIR